MKDQDLDRLFKTKLSEAAYPYNPDNWARMEQLLDARTTGVAPWYWRYSAALLALGILLGGLITFQGASSSSPASTPVEAQPSAAAPEGSLGPPTGGTEASTDAISFIPFQEALGKAASKAPAAAKESETPPAIASETSASSQDASPSSPHQLAQGTGTVHTSTQKTSKAPADRRHALNNVYHGEPAAMHAEGLNRLPSPALKIPWLPDTNSQPLAEAQQDIFIPGKSAFSQHQLLVEGGLSLSSSFGDGFATGMMAGLLYQWQPSSSFGLSMGFHFRQTGDLSIAIREDTTYFTNQGRQDVSTVKRFAYFQTLNFPIRAQWHINHKHVLAAGAYLGLSLRQKAHLITTTQQPKSSPEVARDQVSGQHPEFTGTLGGLSLGYTYQLNKKLEVGLQLRYGLSDMTQDRVAPELASFHRLKQAEVVLRYRLF